MIQDASELIDTTRPGSCEYERPKTECTVRQHVGECWGCGWVRSDRDGAWCACDDGPCVKEDHPERGLAE